MGSGRGLKKKAPILAADSCTKSKYEITSRSVCSAPVTAYLSMLFFVTSFLVHSSKLRSGE